MSAGGHVPYGVITRKRQGRCGARHRMPRASEADIVSDRCQEIAIPDVSPSGALRATQNFEGFSVTADRSQTQGEPAQETPDETARTGIDTTVPHSARIWTYWLAGRANSPVARAAGRPVAPATRG